MKRKNTAFIARYSVNLLLLSTLLAFLRLLFPIDLYYAQIINIHKIYCFFKPFFTLQLFNNFTLYQVLLIIWLLGFFLFVFYYLFISLFEIHKLNKLESINLPVIENLISQYSNRKIIIKVSTTIDIPKQELAHFALLLLLDQQKKAHKECVRIELPCRLIERESCTYAPC